jgi:hypothetical protein
MDKLDPLLQGIPGDALDVPHVRIEDYDYTFAADQFHWRVKNRKRPRVKPIPIPRTNIN